MAGAAQQTCAGLRLTLVGHGARPSRGARRGGAGGPLERGSPLPANKTCARRSDGLGIPHLAISDLLPAAVGASVDGVRGGPRSGTKFIAQ